MLAQRTEKSKWHVPTQHLHKCIYQSVKIYHQQNFEPSLTNAGDQGNWSTDERPKVKLQNGVQIYVT